MEREINFWVGRRVDFNDFTGVISIEIGDELIVVSCYRRHDWGQNVQSLEKKMQHGLVMMRNIRQHSRAQ